jgi:molybdopterin-binding protein
MALQVSARNQLPGKVVSVKLGNVMAQIDLQVGDNHVVAAITRESALELNLQEGDEVIALIKSTDVMIGKVDAEGERHGV